MEVKHKAQARVRRLIEEIKQSSILEENKDKILDFDKLVQAKNFSDYTRIHYLFCLKMLCDKIKKPFSQMNKEDITDFVIHLKNKYAIGSQDVYRACVKKFFQWINKMDGDYPESVKWIKRLRRNNNILPEEILRPEDIKKMLQYCDNFRDQAIVICLYESACRVGEFLALKIKHVEFDKYVNCARLTIPEGKTGRRKIPLIDSIPYLRSWMNNHPMRDDQDCPLWVSLRLSSKTHKPKLLGYEGIRLLLLKVGRRAGIKKRIYPHLLRHSRLTELAKVLTEAELRIFAGWSGDSTMPKTYVHLSGRDVEDKILKLRGLKKIDETEKETQLSPRKCPTCQEINPATAKFCNKCSTVLDLKTVVELDERRKNIDNFMNYLVKDPEFRQLVEVKKAEWLKEKAY